jgi:cell shape-determining protein MreC
MIIELMILQLTLDGIMAQYNENIQRQQTQRKIGLLKLRLAKLVHDYQSGKISPEEYEKLEADIRSAVTTTTTTTTTANATTRANKRIRKTSPSSAANSA